MILKERNSAEHPETDKWAAAGTKAEEQMAFYLRRVFLDDKDIYVFNDLRFKDDTNDSAQIDHLILHRHGFIVIESKSVSSKIKINEHNEWERLWNNHWEGMPSPIQQAKRQIEFLQRALNAYADSLVSKTLGIMQTKFYNCPFEIIVAVSDNGSVKRDVEIPEVIKADQVPDKVKEIYARHHKASKLLGLNQPLNSNIGLYNFSDDERAKIGSFLIEHHYPLDTKKKETIRESRSDYKTDKQPSPAKSSTSTDGNLGICNKCGEQCIIKWGRDYYWKCTACGNNMPLKEYCPICRKKMFLRKEKNLYHIYCETCGGERPYCKFVTE